MPYSMSNLPEAMKGKSKKSKEIFIAKFNSVLKESGKEATAYSIAYSAVDKHEKKVKQLKKSQGAMPWHLKAALQLPVEVTKATNTEQRLATFVVMVPNEVDLHGDTTDEQEVMKACYNFNMFSRKANLFHLVQTDKFSIVESYISPVDFELDSRFVKKGTWLCTVKCHDDDLWSLVKSGDICSVSIGAMAKVEAIE